MSSTSREEIAGRVVPRSLKDELASLRIERKEESRPSRTEKPRLTDASDRAKPERAPRRGPGFGLRLLTLLLWAIPLGMVGGGGYYAYITYAKMRAKPEVTTATVESMTSNQAQSLLKAKG